MVKRPSAGVKPQPGNRDTLLVRPFLEKAFVDLPTDFSKLTVLTEGDAHSGQGVHKQLGYFAVEAVIPPSQSDIDRETVVWIMQSFGQTLLEAALHKIAADGAVTEEYLYKILYDGRERPPLASPIKDGRSSPLVSLSVWPENRVNPLENPSVDVAALYQPRGPQASHALAIGPAAKGSIETIDVNPQYL